jgi:hypothetical protein
MIKHVTLPFDLSVSGYAEQFKTRTVTTIKITFLLKSVYADCLLNDKTATDNSIAQIALVSNWHMKMKFHTPADKDSVLQPFLLICY